MPDTFDVLLYLSERSETFTDPADDVTECDVIFISHLFLSLLFLSFFLSVGVASDTDHEQAAKSNQAIMACNNILSHVAKCLYPHILRPLLSITCGNNSVQRCAAGQSRPAVIEVRSITSDGKVFSLRKACVMEDIFSARLLSLTSIISLLPGWYVVMLLSISGFQSIQYHFKAD